MQFNLSALQGDRMTALCNVVSSRYQLPETNAQRAFRIAGELNQAPWKEWKTLRDAMAPNPAEQIFSCLAKSPATLANAMCGLPGWGTQKRERVQA
jgi:hypothetical protein